jgi:hypothetical protein
MSTPVLAIRFGGMDGAPIGAECGRSLGGVGIAKVENRDGSAPEATNARTITCPSPLAPPVTITLCQ